MGKQAGRRRRRRSRKRRMEAVKEDLRELGIELLMEAAEDKKWGKMLYLDLQLIFLSIL